MTDLSRQTALVYDHGLFPYMASRLVDAFGRVLYHSPSTAEMFPVAKKALCGSGLPGVERVEHFFEHLDDADVVIFPDIGAGPLQMWLREHGHRVWGSGNSETIEVDRQSLKRLQKAKKMPLPEYWCLRGLDALREHLQDPDNENQYVKLSIYRGDVETFKHRNWWLTEPWFKELAHKVGPMAEMLEFVVEGLIKDAVEPGCDTYCIDGMFPNTMVWGYEAKDVAYGGRVSVGGELPEVLREVNDQLSEVLGTLGCRSMFSTEVRVIQDGTGYLIDPCARAPSPPSEVILELYENWPQIIYDGAGGVLTEPVPRAKFIAELVLRSPWAEGDFLALRFPEEMHPFIKLHGHCRIDGTDYVAGLDMDVIGGAVGMGETLDEAIEQATEVAKSIEGHQITFEESGFDEVRKSIEQGTQHGVYWE